MTSPTYWSNTPSEKCSLTWKIADFAVIRGFEQILEAQKLQFEMGVSIGLPTKWKCYLQCKEVDGKVWIGAFVGLDKASVSDQKKKVLANWSSKVGDGKYFTGSEGKIHNMMEKVGRGYPKMIPQDEKEDSKVLPLNEDGSLSLNLEIILFNFKPVLSANMTPTLSSLEFQFEATFKATLQKDFGNMFNCPVSNSTTTPMMVRVTSSDGTEFLVNRGILAARSDVFRTMFQTPMAEVKQGFVKVDDISGPALKILLSFMHDGVLPAGWKDPEIIMEFVYGAHKYMLEDVKQFLDQALAMVCTSENCVSLLNLANKLDMKTAAKELLEVFKGHVKEASWENMDRLFKNGYPNQK